MMAKKVKVRAKFYLFLLIVAVIIGALIWILIRNQKQGTLYNGNVSMALSANAVVIRDEVCVTTERYDKVIFQAFEGEYVQSGSEVADVFKWGYNDEIMQSLLNVQKKILAAQLRQVDGIDNTEISGITAQLKSKQIELRTHALDGDDKDMLTLEREIKELMLQRDDYLAQTVQPSEELSELYQEEQTRETQLSEYMSRIQTVNDGLISFYFDGYEQVINASKLDLLNAELVKSAIKGANVAGSNVITENLLYRLTNRDHFYVAFLTSASSAMRIASGETYTMTIDGKANVEYQGVALAPVVESDMVVNIIEFNQDIGELSDVRVIKAIIAKNASGIAAPLDAIASKDGKQFLTLLINDEQQNVDIEVVAADESMAVIRGSAIAAGQKFIKP